MDGGSKDTDADKDEIEAATSFSASEAARNMVAIDEEGDTFCLSRDSCNGISEVIEF